MRLKKNIDQQVHSVLKLITLEEKVGQLNQYNDDWNATGPVTIDSTKKEQVRKGQVRSFLNCVGTLRTRIWEVNFMQEE